MHREIRSATVISTGARLALYSGVALALLAVLLWLTLPAAPAGFDWDDTWYLWMAEWFSGRDDHRDVLAAMLQTRQYPPLFPYLLSHVGDLLADVTAGLVLNAVLLCGGAVVTLAWLMHRGMSVIAAVTGSIFIVINPVALSFIPTLMSEPLFIALTSVVLLLASRDSEKWQPWVLAGLLTGLAVATRSAGWALVIALLIAALPMLVCAVAMLVP